MTKESQSVHHKRNKHHYNQSQTREGNQEKRTQKTKKKKKRLGFSRLEFDFPLKALEEVFKQSQQ